MKKRNRLNRCCGAVICAAILLTVSGCWNYRGLDELAIIAGMALDYESESNRYRATFEIIDLSKPVKESGLVTLLLDSEGETIFDAIRNAGKKIKSKLYLGHMMIVILSEELARSDKLVKITNWFMRDAECRETMYFLISQEKRAAEILKAASLEGGMVSYEIENILKNDKKNVLSTYPVQLFEIYSKLNNCSGALSLPAIRLTDRNGKPCAEINGTAVFRDRILAGYLSPDESKYLLFALDEAEGGLLTVQCPGDAGPNITLEVEKSRMSRTFRAPEGKNVIELKLTTDVYIGETDGRLDSLDDRQITQVAEAAKKKLEQRIMEVMNKIRTEFRADALGFCELIRKHDPEQWERIKDNWDMEFQELTIIVTSRVNIKNTAILRK